MHPEFPQTIAGVQRFRRRLKKLAARLPLRPLIRFVYAYVLRRGFLDGRPGLIFCGLLAFYDFLILANRYEQQLGPARGLAPVPKRAGERAEPVIPQLGGSPH